MNMSTQALRDWELHYEQTNYAASNDFRSEFQHRKVYLSVGQRLTFAQVIQ